MKDGKIRPPDTCVFINTLVADNDTRGSHNLIKRQNEIIGTPVNGKAEKIPCLNHLLKGNNNDMFNQLQKEPAFRGKNCLTPVRICSIQSDIRKAVQAYHPHVGEDEERQKCLKQLSAIIRHHCGDHS